MSYYYGDGTAFSPIVSSRSVVCSDLDPCVEHLWFCLFCLLSLCHRARQGHQEVRFHDEENFMPSNLMDEAMKKCKKEAINDMLRYNAYTGEQCCRRIGSYHN
ncbi:hypothetical protein Q1695_003789 [Nippostrongylus brasiliensis]|nr:hypothetical protein Q1695_003789 [Nippostrongylus brasiliensis]